MIYKIFRQTEWAELGESGTTAGAPVDVSDGFIHFSTGAQVRGTVSRHFADETGLWLAAVEAAPLGAALKWEPSRGGALFPHLYRDLALGDILWCTPLLPGSDGWQFPEGIE